MSLERFYSLFLLVLLSLTILGAGEFAYAAPVPTMAWVEEASEVAVEWRSSSSWVWHQKKFALQVWIEIPRDLSDDVELSEEQRGQIQIVAGGKFAPFKLAAGHVFLVIHMRSSSESVLFEPTAGSQTRALRLTIENAKTTWMRHSSCRELEPYLSETSHEGDGPLFIALYCSRPSDPTKPSAIEIQISDEAQAKLSAKPPATLQEKLKLIVPLQKAGDDPAQVLANLEVEDHQGQTLAKYIIRRTGTVEVNAIESAIESAIEYPPTPKIKKRVGIAGAIYKAHRYEGANHNDKFVSPSLTATVVAEVLNDSREVRSDFFIPLAKFKNQVASLGWFRAFVQRTDRKSSAIFGFQFTRLKTPEISVGNPFWFSPSLGWRFLTKTEAGEWQIHLQPMAFGAGSNVFRRIQTSVRGELGAYASENVHWRPYVEAVMIVSPSSNEKFTGHGFNFGLQGEF